jgi:hypothetical protein
MALDKSIAANQYKTVHCERHGDRREAYICDHLLHGTRQGFFTDADETVNPYPDAWCSKCDLIRSTYGGADGDWNDKSGAMIKVRLVCGDCYEEIKSRNILKPEGTSPLQ